MGRERDREVCHRKRRECPSSPQGPGESLGQWATFFRLLRLVLGGGRGGLWGPGDSREGGDILDPLPHLVTLLRPSTPPHRPPRRGVLSRVLASEFPLIRPLCFD